MLALLLGLSIAGVAAGGLVALAARRAPLVLAGLKGLAAGAIGVLVFFDIVPEIVDGSGAAGLGVAVGAFALLHYVERLGGARDHAEPHGRFGAAELVLLALIVHSALDGVGLAAAAASGGSTGASVAAAIVAHQFPVSAVLMWAFASRGSVRGAVARLGLLAASVVAGAAGGSVVLGAFAPIEPYALAFASGTLLHVLGHDFAGHHAHRRGDRAVEAGAFVLAAAGTMLVPEVNPWAAGAAPAARYFAETAFGLLAAGAPFYLAGLAAAGLLRAHSSRMGPHDGILGAVTVGTACACDAVGHESSAPPGAARGDVIAFVLLASGLGLDGLALGIGLVGWHLTLARIVVVLASAGALGLLVSLVAGRRRVEAHGGADGCDREHEGDDHGPSGGVAPASAVQVSFARGFVRGVVETADHSGPWLVLGIVLASATLLVAPADLATRLPPPMDVGAAVLAALPFYLCAPAAVPAAFAVLAAGLSPGAAVVVLFLGPAVSAARLRTMARGMGAASAVAFAAGAVALAVGAGLLVNALGVRGAPALPQDPGGVGALGWTCAAGTAAIFVAAFFRVGPLHWIATVGGVVPSAAPAPGGCECQAIGEVEDGRNQG